MYTAPKLHFQEKKSTQKWKNKGLKCKSTHEQEKKERKEVNLAKKKISYPLEKNSIYLCECGEYLFYLLNEKKNKESNAENSSDDLSCKQNEQEEAMRNVIFFLSCSMWQLRILVFILCMIDL